MKLTKNKKTLIRIAIAALMLIVGVVLENSGFEQVALIIFICGYAVVGYDVLYNAAKNIFVGAVFDENLLMTIASLGAFFVGEYPEALAVLTLYQLGEVFQRYAVGKSRQSISSIMKLRPDKAYLSVNGEEREVEPEEVCVDDVLIVHAGDRIPIDGKVVSGESYLDVSALTGESVPVFVKEGDCVLGGAINSGGVIKIRCTAPYSESTVARILELAENASDKKAKAENFITKFAAVYTPIVVIAAVLVAIIPSLITGEWIRWIYTALNFLVVSCPCAIVISVPMGFFCGIGAASELGLLVKGSNYIELIAKANVFAMDKTGTVTKGEFAVQSVFPDERRDETLRLAAIAESGSLHPIALAVKKSVDVCSDGYEIREIGGKGMVAVKNDEVILAGNEALMADNRVEIDRCDAIGSVVYVAKNGEFIGSIVVADEIKPTSKQAVRELKKRGGKTVMLTGDNKKTAESVASEVGIEQCFSALLPADKVNKIEEIIENKNKNDVVCYLGDGINDAPSLIRADVGIAMGNIGSDSAIEAADALLMNGDLSALNKAIGVCKKTIRIVKENVIFSLTIKILVMVFAVLGFSNMWISVFADVGVAMLAILNSLRLSKIFSRKKS